MEGRPVMGRRDGRTGRTFEAPNPLAEFRRRGPGPEDTDKAKEAKRRARRNNPDADLSGEVAHMLGARRPAILRFVVGVACERVGQVDCMQSFARPAVRFEAPQGRMP